MKNFTLFTFLLLHPIFSNAQAPSWEWATAPSYNSSAWFSKIALTSSGMLYVAGDFRFSSSSGSLNFGNTLLNAVNGSGTSTSNIFLTRYNSNGDNIWAVQPEKTPNNTWSSDNITSITVDNVGNSYIAGKFSYESLIFNTDTLINTTGYYNSFIVKYDAGGNAVWALNIYDPNISSHTSISEITIDKDGYIYCTGYFESSTLKIQYYNNSSITETTITNSGSGKNIFLIKYTADGNLAWAKSYGGASVSELSTCISTDINNNIFIGGYWESGTASLGDSSFTSKGGYDAFVIKLDAGGTVLSAVQMGSTGDDAVTAIKANSNVYITGYFKANISIGSYSLTNNGFQDIFLIKLNNVGLVKWAKSYGGASPDSPYSLALDNTNEKIFISGTYASSVFTIGNDTLGKKGYTDIFLAKIDSLGNEKWATHIGGDGEDINPGIVYDGGQHLYIAGSFYQSSTLVVDSYTLLNGGVGYCPFIASLIDNDTTGTTNTDTSTVTLTYELDNGGLYGGSSADLTYSSTTGRLFSGIETPASLFISDDDAATWYPAFENDSLEFGGKSRGWSGKASKILTNQNGWVAVQTNHPKGRYSSVAMSYENGDTLSWKTMIDPVRLAEWDSTFTFQHVSSIALSDYYLVAALGTFIIRKDSGSIKLNDIKNILTLNTNLPLTSKVYSIAISNNVLGYPYYLAVDENGNENGYNRKLFRYNGLIFTELTLPANLNGIRTVFTHPTQKTGDTLFITGIDINTSEYKVYRSFDSGANWTDVSYPSAIDFLSDVDYSSSWNLSTSNNAILIIHGSAISKDMGTTWETLGTEHSANAIDPTDMNTIVGSGKAIEISTSGTSGNFVKTANAGLEALEVNKLARTESKSVFYIATKTGLGYTTAYLDTSVSATQKWQSPYGEFPLISDSIHFGAVAIDPTDSLHVIAGSPYGFYVTTTGANGFSVVTPANFTTDNPQVHDIAILNNTISIAVTGGDSTYDAGKGKIWRTNDRGLTWTDVYSPTGFNSGNTIAIGYGTTDTVLYIGSGLMNADKGYLWKSADLGITWSKINNGPTSLAGTSILGLPINDIAIDPRGSDTLYIAAGYDNEFASVLSLDGGNSYIYLNNFSGEPFTSITINPENPDTVYMATGREIYLYDFAKNDFRFMYRGLPDERIPDLMSGSVIAATSTGFYTYHPTWEDDADSTIITNNQIQLANGYEANVYPNPFSNEATVNIYANEGGKLNIDLYDLMGRKAASVYHGNCHKGYNTYKITANHLASGSYLLYVNVDNSAERRLLYHVR